MKTLLLKYRAENERLARQGLMTREERMQRFVGVSLALGAVWDKPSTKIFEVIFHGEHI